MFLELKHQGLDVYKFSRQFVLYCYRLTTSLPSNEKFGMVTQIRRAALSVHLNVAEGCSRHSENERKRYYEIARSSVIEIDAALDVAGDPGYLTDVPLATLAESMVRCFKLLSGMITAKSKQQLKA
jgi:four helix bundle protein